MIPGTNAALSVLLIDDDVELVRLLTQLFAREGIALRSATTGAAGLSGLSPLPSLVLLDLMLPDMHGKEVFRRLRERLPALVRRFFERQLRNHVVVASLEAGELDEIALRCRE